MPRHKSSASRGLFFLGLIMACLIISGMVGAMVEVPRQVASRFGSPDQGVPFPARWYYAWQLFWASDSLRPVSDGGQASNRVFVVNPGESADSVARRLQDEGIIRDAQAFRALIIYTGLDQGIQAGEYLLSPGMDALQIAQALQRAGKSDFTFVVLPGWRAEEIANALWVSGLLSDPKDFLGLVYHPPALSVLQDLGNPPTLEGFLAPGAYTFRKGMLVSDIILQMLQRSAQMLSADLRQGFQEHGLSLYQGVILASMVEREGVVEEEYPLIASVFLNRLAIGMKLDSDPTVQYALGYDASQKTWWKNPLSLEDLRTDSPYNTYIYSGLPPTPICNPGLAALKAVAFPAQSSYYYFRASCEDKGRHVFSQTYQEHLSKACP